MKLATLLEPPEEQVTPQPKAAVLLMVFCVLGSLVAANALAVVETENRPRNLGYEVVQAKWALIDAASEPVDLLFVGDSSCNQGIIPTRVTAITGQTALNLCTIGSATVADDAWMLDYYIEHVGVPGAVVMVHTWDTLRRDNTLLRRMLWTISSGPDAWEGRAPALELGPSSWLLARIGRWVPIYTQNISLRESLSHPLDAPTIEFLEHGFMPMYDAPERAAERDIEKHLALVREEPFEASSWSQSGLDALVALAVENGIPLRFVMAPVHEELSSHEEFSEYIAGYRALLAGVAAEAEDVELLTESPMAISGDLLEKVDHVTLEGAEIYTDFVAQLLLGLGD